MLEEKSRLDLDSMITVVVPTLNEEEAIARVIQELHSVGLRRVMVIDGSRGTRPQRLQKNLAPLFFSSREEARQARSRQRSTR